MIRTNYKHTIAIAALLVGGSSLRAEDAETKLGLKLVEHLPEIKIGEQRAACIETRFNGQAVGYSLTVLRGIKTESGPRYEYSDFSLIHGPDGQVRVLHTSGTLTNRFQPESITWEAVSKSPTGSESKTKESLRVDGAKLILEDGDAKKITTAEVPLPKEHFVHIAGHLFGLLPLKDGQLFRLQDFDTEKKAFVWRNYRVTKNQGRELRVSVLDDDGAKETAYYTVSGEGEILDHGLPGTPLTFVRCTPERIEELKKEWSKPFKATTQPSKNKEKR